MYPTSLTNFMARVPGAARLARVATGVLAVALLLGASVASAAVPSTATVEGLLASAGGGPAADGNYNVTFAIYAAETGGSAVWSEGPVSITAKSGQFSWQLGSKAPLSTTTLSMTTAWLGVTIGSDPELGRRPLNASLYALRAAVAESLECSGCLKATALDAGVLQPYAKTADLSIFAKSADLAAYVKATDLAGYAKTADLGAYAKTSDLTNYVQASALAKVAGTGSYTDLINAPNLAKVAVSGSYADLLNAPAAVAVGKLCGTGLFLKGFNADGSINCLALKETDMPGDGIDEVSNGLINNQFADSQAGTADVAIPDGLGAGKTDTLTFPDIGLAQKIWVNMTLNNSDLSGVKVELYGPGISTPYVLYSGGKTGTVLTTNFNTDTPIVSGDMNADWVGKNIKGSWSITVKDLKTGGGTGGFDGKYNWTIAIQTLSSKKIQIKGNVLVDGSVKVGTDSATCAAGVEGTLRYNNNTIELCNGSAWIPWFGTGGFSGSKIVTPVYAAMINGWVGNPFKTWKLCYRRSDDGAASSTFHSKCNNKGDTVTVATLDNGQIIGGYAGCSWYSNANYRYQCGGSFVFNLIKGHKFNKRTYENGDSNSFSYSYWTYDNNSYGPTWGGGHDLYIASDMTTGYCNLGHDYTCRFGSAGGYSGYGDAACQNDFCGSYNSWKITELEVWSSL